MTCICKLCRTLCRRKLYRSCGQPWNKVLNQKFEAMLKQWILTDALLKPICFLVPCRKSCIHSARLANVFPWCDRSGQVEHCRFLDNVGIAKVSSPCVCNQCDASNSSYCKDSCHSNCTNTFWQEKSKNFEIAGDAFGFGRFVLFLFWRYRSAFHERKYAS